MADTTREAEVKVNVKAVEDNKGAEAWNHIIVQLLKDINISLAMLVDAGANSET